MFDPPALNIGIVGCALAADVFAFRLGDGDAPALHFGAIFVIGFALRRHERQYGITRCLLNRVFRAAVEYHAVKCTFDTHPHIHQAAHRAVQFVISAADPVEPADNQHTAMPQVVFNLAPLFAGIRRDVIAAYAFVNKYVLRVDAVCLGIRVLAGGRLSVSGRDTTVIEFPHVLIAHLN
ncbi:hypothetical protein X961_5198 [Burkholderia pseudomallei MSHR5613]|nr:hypothetical protein X961_5198 [Burkholderia pseudomallei MSHR5613]